MRRSVGLSALLLLVFGCGDVAEESPFQLALDAVSDVAEGGSTPAGADPGSTDSVAAPDSAEDPGAESGDAPSDIGEPADVAAPDVADTAQGDDGAPDAPDAPDAGARTPGDATAPKDALDGPQPSPAVGCEEAFVANDGPPDHYPPFWAPEAGAKEVYDAALSSFFDGFGVDKSLYLISTHAVTFTPKLKAKSTGECEACGEPSDLAAVLPYTELVATKKSVEVAEAFLADHGDLFQAGWGSWGPWGANCKANFCQAWFDQDYCGLPLAFQEGEPYDGHFQLRYLPSNGILDYVYSNLVPIIPVPVDPALTKEEAQAAMVGAEIVYWCIDGKHTAGIGELTEKKPVDGLEIFVVRPNGLANYLEYRTAYRFQVLPEDAPGFVFDVWIDAFDGKLIHAFSKKQC